MKIKTALKAAAVAATLIFSTASHAGIAFLGQDGGIVQDDGTGKQLHGDGFGNQFLETYDLTGSTLAAQILAFCVQPSVEQVSGAVYTQHAAVSDLSTFSQFTKPGLANRAARIQSLFEQNYDNLSTSELRLGFALALWDLVADDGNLSAGAQTFTSNAFGYSFDTGEMIDLVATQHMLDLADGQGLTYGFKYTLFTGRTANSMDDDSQALLSVSSVPEADTWAMLVAGLGMIGFMGRRRSKQSEKFAA